MDPISAVSGLIGNVIDRIWPDATEAAKAKLALAQMVQNGQLAELTAQTDLLKGQLAVDQAEAASDDPFTSRARPFIIWACGAALVWTYILAPFIVFGLNVAGHPVPKMPTLDDHMFELMGTMLGMGGWHAYENISAAKASK